MSLRERLRAWLHVRFPPRTLGERGERLAARHLRRRGYTILGRQVQTKFGELDLVAVDGRTLVFVEVKTRRSHDTGHPAEAVDRRKQVQLTRLALAYLKRHGLLDHPTRFDVVAVTWPPDAPPIIEHYPNAFEAQGSKSLYG